jgi:hypothetical protein
MIYLPKIESLQVENIKLATYLREYTNVLFFDQRKYLLLFFLISYRLEYQW